MPSHPDTWPITDADEAPPTIGFHKLRVRFGRADYSDDRFCAYLQLLIDDQGFPPPLPRHVQPRRKDRSTPLPRARLCCEPHPKSQWPAHAVDAWFEDFLPPANAAQVEASAMREAANDMDEAACHLHLVGGREG
ncbi:hypothetical protein [Aurantiacibacter zhengii]|uniref:Uncharacterized protein n=1 Tax=Aurantiacibacter zhengii TaxID=2307003 RepID=A0A418NU86_9SPHN|nr:hypothetical protein [Aurantiacibacter zhengii]RIV87478.1 hypothetical protein D2V07_03770 [Aurantiacibacter zhengii]